MFGSAVSAEIYKVLRHRAAIFWGFAFVPIVCLGLDLLGLLFVNPASAQFGIVPRADQAIWRALGVSASPFFQVFYIMGAATIFGSEYRWENWRLLIPRAKRTHLLLCKFAVFGLLGFVSLLALGVAGGLGMFASAAVQGAAPGAPTELPTFALQTLGVLATSWLELSVTAALVAVLVVVTRSIVAAIVAVLTMGFVQALLISFLPGVYQSPVGIAALPALAADILRAYATQRAVGLQGEISTQLAAFGAAALLLWLLTASLVAVMLFRRQELSRE